MAGVEEEAGGDSGWCALLLSARRMQMFASREVLEPQVKRWQGQMVIKSQCAFFFSFFLFYGRGARIADPKVRRWMCDSGYLLMAALDM